MNSMKYFISNVFIVGRFNFFVVTLRLLPRRPSTSSRLSRPLPRTLSSRRSRSRCKKTASIASSLGFSISGPSFSLYFFDAF